MPKKPKTNQPETPNEVQERDFFQTPNYAVDLLIPFLPKRNIYYIWECAAGNGKIAKRLLFKLRNSVIFSTDIKKTDWVNENNIVNFLDNASHLNGWIDNAYEPMIITNPPFSLKRKFYERCLKYNVPFALLIPADYSGWIIEAVNKDGAEKIIPTRRIDYITPNILKLIHYKEAFRLYCKDSGWKGKMTDEILHIIDGHYPAVCNYDSIENVPTYLIAKYSTSQFHSMWLTHGFNLGKTETFVELSLKEKKENI